MSENCISTTAASEGPSPLEAASYLFHLLTAVARLRDDGLDRTLEPIGLNASLFRVLEVTARFGPCAMTETAAFSVIDRTTATRITDQLVRLGLVDRYNCPADRRQVLLNLTEAGRAKHSAAEVLVTEHQQSALTGLSGDSARAIIEATQALVANLMPEPEDVERVLTFRRPSVPAKCQLHVKGRGGETVRCSLQCKLIEAA
jgi:DNA-binding MarR family transcriptional regulator